MAACALLGARHPLLPSGSLRCLLLPLLWLCATLPLHAAGVAQGYSFAAVPASGSANVGVQALTPEEREFLRRLPAVRVGIAQTGLPPYESIGKDGSIAGLHPQILANLARAFGFRIQPVVFDRSSEVFAAARRGEVDLLMSATVTPERAEYLEFTLGITPKVFGIFARTGQPAAAREPRFAVLPGNASTAYVKRQMGDAQLLDVIDDVTALQALRDKRADYYLGELLTTLDTLQRAGPSGIEVQRSVEIGTGYHHFAVRKALAPLARILNKAIVASAQPAANASAWSATVANLPASLQPFRSRRIEPRNQGALIERPVWRLGAVKGLTLLEERDEQGQYQGLGVELAEAVTRQLGTGLQVQAFDSVSGMLDALRAGSIDVASLVTRTADRVRDFGYSRPAVEMPHVIVTRSQAPLVWDLESLRGKRVALEAQHPMRELLARRFPDIQILEVSAGQAAMNAVAEGQADAAIEARFFAHLRMQQEGDGLLRAAAMVPELPASFHFATSARARALIPVIDEALAAIPAGEQDRLLRRWSAPDAAAPLPWRRYSQALAVAGTALLLLAGLGAVWMWRLRREVEKSRHWQTLLHDVAAAAPWVVTFRHRRDASGQMLDSFVSPHAAALLGVPPAPGSSVQALLAPGLSTEDRQAIAAAEVHSRRTGEPLRIDCRHQLPGQAARWLHGQAVRTHDEQGNEQWTGFVADVTAEHQLQQRLAEEAQARHQMLVSASHELRAPTHNLTLALQNIDRSALDDNSADSLRVAQTSARTLALLLDDVLDAPRLEGGLLQLRPVSFDLPALLNELAQSWAVVARAKGLSFATEFSPGLPTHWLQDPLRLRQLLTNLLSNACKYTRQGGVTLAARRQGAALIFSVRDTGRGISKEDQAHLFRPFETLDELRPIGIEGGHGGLGLAMCKRIATLGGGRISLHSRPGEGSEFTVWLPWVLDDFAVAPVPSPARMGFDAKPAGKSLAFVAAQAAVATAANAAAQATEGEPTQPSALAGPEAKAEATDEARGAAEDDATPAAEEPAAAVQAGRLTEQDLPAPAADLERSAGDAGDEPEPQDTTDAAANADAAAGPAQQAAAEAPSSDTVAAAEAPSADDAAETGISLTLSIPASTEYRAAGNARIVICDEDPLARRLTAQILRHSGCEVFEAADAENALSLWDEHEAKVVITDLSLPGHDGRWLIFRIRERESRKGWRTAIIVCSVEEPPAAGRARLNGPQAHFRKPVQPGLLLAELSRLGVLREVAPA